MRTSVGTAHGYWCEVGLEGRRWVWVVKLEGTEIERGTTRWRWLARICADEVAKRDHEKALRKLKREEKRRGYGWKPEL